MIQMNNLHTTSERSDGASRRAFLKAALPIACSAGIFAKNREKPVKPSSAPILLYVGTYSSPQGPEGSRGRGEGIYLFQMNPSTGALKQMDVFANGSNPSCLALDPSGTHLYAANETSTFQGKPVGSVTAYSISRPSGRLTELTQRRLRGGRSDLSERPPFRQARSGGELLWRQHRGPADPGGRTTRSGHR